MGDTEEGALLSLLSDGLSPLPSLHHGLSSSLILSLQ